MEMEGISYNVSQLATAIIIGARVGSELHLSFHLKLQVLEIVDMFPPRKHPLLLSYGRSISSKSLYIIYSARSHVKTVVLVELSHLPTNLAMSPVCSVIVRQYSVHAVQKCFLSISGVTNFTFIDNACRSM